MHILFLTDNFPPEVNAPASRTFDHVSVWLEREDVSVTVITCAPNFPGGTVFEGYSNKLVSVERDDRLTVMRVWTYITLNSGFLKRTLDYISFGISSFIAGLFVKRPDVIIATSPQIFTACSGAALGVVRRKPFVFELRDLWPESIRAVGATSNEGLLRFLEGIEYALYRSARLIVSVTRSFKEILVSNGIEPEKITVVTNGVNSSLFSPMSKDPSLELQHDLNHRVVFGYIGTHGMAHALETLIEAAHLVEQKGYADRFALMMVGDGARKEAVSVRAGELQVTSVRFVQSVPKSEVASHWALLDVAIVHLRNTPLFRTVIPSKIFECMGMGIPILMGVAGESGDLVAQEGAGISFEPENAIQLAESMILLIEDSARREALAQAARDAAPKYDRRCLAVKMLAEVEALVD